MGPSQQRWKITGVLIALVCLPQASIGLYLPSLPHMINDLKTNASEIQLTLSLYMVGYALSTLCCGFLSDRYGRKPVILWGLSIYVIASLCCLLAPNVWILIIGRFFQAVGGCCGTVVARVIAKDLFSQKAQIKTLTYLSTAIALTPAIAPIIGGGLEVTFGWRMSFILLVTYSSILWVIIQLWVRETNQQPLKKIGFQSILGNYKRLLTNRLFLAYSLAISLAWCAYYTYIQTSSFVFQTVLGISPIVYGFLYGVVIVGYIVGTFFTRKFSNDIGLNRVILIEGTLAFVSASIMLTLALGGINTVWSIILPMVLLMVGVGGIFPACQASVMEPFEEIAGTASGLFFFLQMISGAICGFILGTIHVRSSLPMIITIFLSCLLLVVSFYILIWREERKGKTLAA
ncbi:MFS transporter, DHA1 family, bicyclomycin/chloramphenicol resistance protein [Marininema mesophilum]|uniref:Bcr/CflA family efflux transporter n=1 Tax=Marininema mesophilum TaxID=1048340 RepID=A0A1H2ZLS1_9BACL|nr:multidrug effflux MFS transporter [Marininema mesophilum]SDX18296.1 MFS transporter, DHA1 family, bicyclomycin/chloramphenicol resistance protein [Marininema mesophilum]